MRFLGFLIKGSYINSKSENMTAIKETTRVVIVGAGVAGLTAANFLKAKGIDYIILEKQSFAHIEERQRAGTMEVRAVQMFERWGFGEAVVIGPAYSGVTEFILDGESHMFHENFGDNADAPAARLVPQQLLVRNLIKLIRGHEGDLRFDAAHVAITGMQTDKPVVSYTDTEGSRHEITCDFVAGCDGYHGVSRTSIPEGVLTRYAKDYGITWLNILSDAPPKMRMAMSDHGFAAQFGRGPMSRFYLQCDSTDTEEEWTDERIWNELRYRMGDAQMQTGDVTDKLVFKLRSVVFEPMRHGRLFLIGDSAHIISPVGGKGMNLALFDAEAFVLAVDAFLVSGDSKGLDTYSETCLSRTWRYQEYSGWLTEMLHEAGDTSQEMAFRRKLARARFERMMSSPSSAQYYSILQAGLA